MSQDRDLVPRTTDFASQIVAFFIILPREREEAAAIPRQMIRPGTAVAANCHEAARARSTAGSVSKPGFSLQEADETDLWLERLQRHFPIQGMAFEKLRKENSEPIAISVTLDGSCS